MEIKCDICGTINDGNTTYCKGCFQKLNAERKENKEINDIPKVISTIEVEKPTEVPWNDENYEIDSENEKTDNSETNLEESFSSLPEVEPVIEPQEEISEEPVENTEEESELIEEINAPKLEEEQNEEPVENTEEESESIDEINAPKLEEEQNEEPIENKEELESTEEVVEPQEEQNEEPVENTEEESESIDEINAPKLEEEQNEEPIENKEELESTEEVVEPQEEQNEEPVENIEEESELIEEINAPKLEEEQNEESVENKEEPESIEVEQVNDNNLNSVTLDDIESLNRDDETTAEVIEDGIPNLIEQFHEGINPKSKKTNEENETGKIGNYIIKFLIRYSILFVSVFGVLLIVSKLLANFLNKDTELIIEFALNRLAALLTLVFATKLTFKKDAPSIEKLDEVTFKILLFVALPFILLQMFILGFIKSTTVLMFVIGLILSVITLAIFFNYIRNTIKKINEDKSEDKLFFKYGIISIIIVVVLLFTGIFLRTKNLVMPKIDFLHSFFENAKVDDEVIFGFIENVEQKLYSEQKEAIEKASDFQMPISVTDVNYASYGNYKPDSIELNLSDTGTVLNGTIVYRGVKYTYDGENIKAE